ncbi:MAG: type II secretion system protein [Deltaproteobacteria bacterium]|nr:type II secretion system protein [Deltaproteobacteria bacterium]
MRRLASARQAGLTLIELGIALLIVGLLFAAVVPSIEGVTGVRAREASSKLTGVIRYMYNESALSGKPCRMVFDLDAKAYWAECAQGHFVLNAEREKARDGAKDEDMIEKEKLDRELEMSSSSGFNLTDANEMKAEKERILKQAEFSEFTNDTVEKQALPKGVDIGVWVDHQRERYTKGQAFLYFFPQGYTERAQIYVSSGSTVYTLKVSPLTGKVKAVAEELELPKDIK